LLVNLKNGKLSQVAADARGCSPRVKQKAKLRIVNPRRQNAAANN